jgi:hypothetical protein
MKLLNKFKIVDALNLYLTNKMSRNDLYSTISNMGYGINTINFINKNQMEISIKDDLTQKNYTINS